MPVLDTSVQRGAFHLARGDAQEFGHGAGGTEGLGIGGCAFGRNLLTRVSAQCPGLLRGHPLIQPLDAPKDVLLGQFAAVALGADGGSSARNRPGIGFGLFYGSYAKTGGLRHGSRKIWVFDGARIIWSDDRGFGNSFRLAEEFLSSFLARGGHSGGLRFASNVVPHSSGCRQESLPDNGIGNSPAGRSGGRGEPHRTGRRKILPSPGGTMRTQEETEELVEHLAYGTSRRAHAAPACRTWTQRATSRAAPFTWP